MTVIGVWIAAAGIYEHATNGALSTWHVPDGACLLVHQHRRIDARRSGQLLQQAVVAFHDGKQ